MGELGWGDHNGPRWVGHTPRESRGYCSNLQCRTVHRPRDVLRAGALYGTFFGLSDDAGQHLLALEWGEGGGRLIIFLRRWPQPLAIPYSEALSCTPATPGGEITSVQQDDSPS